MAVCQENKRHVAQSGGLCLGTGLGQIKLNGFFDSLAELVQAPGLGVTSGKLRDGGDKIPVFVLFNDDAERFFHFFPHRRFSLAASIIKEKTLFINELDS